MHLIEMSQKVGAENVLFDLLMQEKITSLNVFARMAPFTYSLDCHLD